MVNRGPVKRPGVATATVSRPPAPEADDDDELIFVSAQPGKTFCRSFSFSMKFLSKFLSLKILSGSTFYLILLDGTCIWFFLKNLFSIWYQNTTGKAKWMAISWSLFHLKSSHGEQLINTGWNYFCHQFFIYMNSLALGWGKLNQSSCAMLVLEMVFP